MSHFNPAVLAFHEAYVEAAEQETHQIIVADQAGCVISTVATYFVDVDCADRPGRGCAD